MKAPARILLVTGSRALEGSGSEDAAKAVLNAVARAFCPSVVVAGDARGPDEWAAAWVDELHGAVLRLYALDGWVYDEQRARVRQWSCGHEAERESKPHAWPLLRNRLMVRACAAQRAKDAVVEVLALEAEWSKSKGTAHTVGVARDCGLPVVHIRFELGRS